MNFIAAALIAFTVGGGGLPVTNDQTPEAARLLALLPLESLGWKADGADQVFDRETIFEYIDGSGEVYRAFNMKLLVSRRFNKSGRADVIIDLFDMGSPADAFGVFAHDLEGEDWKIGQASLYKGGLLQFWRGRYFVSIFAESENPATAAVLAELGKAVAAVIGPDGPKPDLVDLIPEEFRGGKVRYIHDPQILNYHFYIASENVLGLGPDADGVLATVGTKSEKRSCLLVRYRNEGEAESSLAAFLRAYLPETRTAETEGERNEGLVRMKDGRFAATGRAGRYFLAVFGEMTAAEAQATLTRAVSQLPR
ncbi:MAG: hypothetical protein NTW38_06295 [Candidatus Aminicenantes bacterium]|nr:hypothetical protein [Candidatus Aminicenantes bacterium]